MRLIRTIAALVPVVLAGALPLLAAEPAAPTATETAPALSVPLQEPEFPWQMPEPMPDYGMKAGPCTVAVTCVNSTIVSCAGQTVCYWKFDSIPSRGFVQCDSQPRQNCPPLDQ